MPDKNIDSGQFRTEVGWRLLAMLATASCSHFRAPEAAAA
jgi:hypothetical protein